jgi:hypothetical protein
MIIYILLLAVPMLLWAAFGFQGLGQRTGAVARATFITLLFTSASVYSVAQAMAP